MDPDHWMLSLQDPQVCFHLLPLPLSGEAKRKEPAQEAAKHFSEQSAPKKGKGKSKGGGKSKNKLRVPKELVGKAYETPSGGRVCWSYNLPSGCAFEKNSFFAVCSPLTKAAEIFRQKVLPFGSRASVAAFILWMAIWMLGVKGLSLLWTCYFDDYLHLAKDTESRHLEVVISTFFNVIGWRVSEDKLLPYDTCCKVLGIRLDLKDFKLGIAALANTEKRQTELRQSLEEVIARGSLRKAEGEKLRGRMQFASGQLFGRRAKTALRTLEAILEVDFLIGFWMPVNIYFRC